MNVVRHDDECVQREPLLIAIVKQCVYEKVGVGFDLKRAAAVRSYRGDEVCAGFLRCSDHREKRNAFGRCV